MNKYLQLYHTIKYLKKEQIFYRLYYLLRKKYRNLTRFSYTERNSIKVFQLTLDESIVSYPSYSNKSFTFLNTQERFPIDINWNFNEHGKLWAYNLNYFEFLNQKSITKEEGVFLINDYINNEKFLKDGLEAFPISLRGINWIKFLQKHQINMPNINTKLYKHYQVLIDNLESSSARTAASSAS